MAAGLCRRGVVPRRLRRGELGRRRRGRPTRRRGRPVHRDARAGRNRGDRGAPGM